MSAPRGSLWNAVCVLPLSLSFVRRGGVVRAADRSSALYCYTEDVNVYFDCT